ncbi:Transmembrane protein 144 [Strongyloides ratti]|uniref:Transmembrane protein 144 n=1 Tax=Strongyloides ratti TaxID=34506 RepID=A0A090L8R6_STRRB|nr:Transmembrane protein 144 [Strongyloides ratti]CEF66156.1 Transmembrane protein 144 [Strongyloides ratti]
MKELFLSGHMPNISEIIIQNFNETITEEYEEKSDVYKLAFGIICGFIGSFSLGSSLVPIRKYFSKDGQVIQFLISISLVFFGAIVQAIQGFPHIRYSDFIGGFFLSLTLVLLIPIINNIGSCLLFIIWNSVIIISFWFFSFFNLYGEIASSTDMPFAQYIGIIFLFLPIIGVFFVKTMPNEFNHNKDNDIPISGENFTMESSTTFSYDLKQYNDFQNIHSLTSSKRIISIGAAISTGICLSVTFYPYNFNTQSLIYMPSTIFSHALGTFLSSFIFFIIYTTYQKGALTIDTRLILPSFFSGFLLILFGVNFIISFYNLSNYTKLYQISYQIFTFIPLLINSLWSIYYFKEIPSKKELIMIVGMIFINILSIFLFTISFK